LPIIVDHHFVEFEIDLFRFVELVRAAAWVQIPSEVGYADIGKLNPQPRIVNFLCFCSAARLADVKDSPRNLLIRVRFGVFAAVTEEVGRSKVDGFMYGNMSSAVLLVLGGRLRGGLRGGHIYIHLS